MQLLLVAEGRGRHEPYPVLREQPVVEPGMRVPGPVAVVVHPIVCDSPRLDAPTDLVGGADDLLLYRTDPDVGRRPVLQVLKRIFVDRQRVDGGNLRQPAVAPPDEPAPVSPPHYGVDRHVVVEEAPPVVDQPRADAQRLDDHRPGPPVGVRKELHEPLGRPRGKGRGGGAVPPLPVGAPEEDAEGPDYVDVDGRPSSAVSRSAGRFRDGSLGEG
mmetsp:Transcript_50809/g.99344  ORF Transcript_50809/g.99344 Transcript_50809/m.99344 type:complete len:215 (-) Transcript_50809:2474-3118(-)